MQVIIIRHGAEKRLRELEQATKLDKVVRNHDAKKSRRLQELEHEFTELQNEFTRFENFIKSLPDSQNFAVLSSPSHYVEKTKKTVLEHLKGSNVIRNPSGELDAAALTRSSPIPGSDLVEDILDEAGEVSVTATPNTWVLIGHHPRVSQFLARVTGTRNRPLGHLHAVCVSAANLTELRLGLGSIKWRYPILDVEGDKLGGKLQSKMVVGALLELVKEPEKTPVIKGTSLGLTTQVFDYATFWRWNHDQWTIAFNSLSILCLSLALVLFIASVYIFDTLAMPEGFLAHEPEVPRIVWPRGRFHNHVIWLGFVYASMINTWRWVFSPAVVLSALAASLLVARMRSLWLLGFWCALIGLAGLYFSVLKPRRIID